MVISRESESTTEATSPSTTLEDGDGSSETQNGSENNMRAAKSNDTNVAEESAPGVEHEATANVKRTQKKAGKKKGQQSSEPEANSEEDGAA